MISLWIKWLEASLLFGGPKSILGGIGPGGRGTKTEKTFLICPPRPLFHLICKSTINSEETIE